MTRCDHLTGFYDDIPAVDDHPHLTALLAFGLAWARFMREDIRWPEPTHGWTSRAWCSSSSLPDQPLRTGNRPRNVPDPAHCNTIFSAGFIRPNDNWMPG